MPNDDPRPARRRILLSAAAAAAALAVALPVSGALAGDGEPTGRDGAANAPVQQRDGERDRDRDGRHDGRDCPKDRDRGDGSAANGGFEAERRL